MRQARVALQKEVLAELGDHLPITTSSTISSSSNSGNSGSGSGSGDSDSNSAGIHVGKGDDTNRWKGNNPMLLSGKKKRKQMLESVEPLASSSSSSSSSSMSSSTSTNSDGGTGTSTSSLSSSLNGGMVVAAGGFTLEQAQGLEGVAKVGHDQPAWKD